MCQLRDFLVEHHCQPSPDLFSWTKEVIRELNDLIPKLDAYAEISNSDQAKFKEPPSLNDYLTFQAKLLIEFYLAKGIQVPPTVSYRRSVCDKISKSVIAMQPEVTPSSLNLVKTIKTKTARFYLMGGVDSKITAIWIRQNHFPALSVEQFSVMPVGIIGEIKSLKSDQEFLKAAFLEVAPRFVESIWPARV